MKRLTIALVLSVLLGMHSAVLLPDYGTKRKTQTSQQVQQKRPTEAPTKTPTTSTRVASTAKNAAITTLNNIHAKAVAANTPQELDNARKNIQTIQSYINQGGILTQEEQRIFNLAKYEINLTQKTPATYQEPIQKPVTPAQQPQKSKQLQPGVAGQIIVYKTKGGEFYPLEESDRQNYISSGSDIDSGTTIFSSLVRYQWPTNLIYADTLSAQDKQELFGVGGNQENFIRNKIKLAYPNDNYDVMSIPYTIYQLFVINHFLTHLDNPTLKEMDNYLYTFFGEFQTGTKKYQTEEGKEEEYDYVNLSSKKDFLNASKAIYNSPLVSQGHFICNNAFCNYYKNKTNLTWQQIAADLIEQVINNYKKNKNKIPRHSEYAEGFDLTRLQRELQGKNLVQGGIIDNLLKCEADAHKNNRELLVRAVDIFQLEIETGAKKQKLDILSSAIAFKDTNDLRKKRNEYNLWTRGNSYGLFLLTGTFYCKWDMSYYYAITLDKEGHGSPTENNYFYALPLDKLSFVNGKEENTLFFIPPFSAFTQLWGHDSLYHGLSHLAQNPIPQQTEPWTIEGFESLYDPYNTLWIQMDPLEFASKLATFESNNAILLKVKKGLNIQTEQVRLRKNLDLASTFYSSVQNEPIVEPTYEYQPAQ